MKYSLNKLLLIILFILNVSCESESNIIDSYELLSNPEDQELFYDYLIANVKLYFDKFETELSDVVDEPTNQAYDMAKSGEIADLSEPTADEVEFGL